MNSVEVSVQLKQELDVPYLEVELEKVPCSIGGSTVWHNCDGVSCLEQIVAFKIE